jgi:hypothetical protein
MMAFLGQRPASSGPSAHPSIQCPHRGPVGCASLSSKVQGRPGSASGCISCLQQALGTFDQGPSGRARHSPTGGRHSRHPPFTSPVAPLALSTCSYGRPRAGGQNKNNSCQPSLSLFPLKALNALSVVVSSPRTTGFQPHPSIHPSTPRTTHAQPASVSGRIAFALLPAVTLPPVSLRLSFTWRYYP